MNFNRKNHHRSFCAISACLIATFSLNPSANAGRIYVDGNLTPCGDGIGWGTAFRYLQDALDEAVFGDKIWVAAGTYYADQSCANEGGTGDRAETFLLVKETFLLGGFDGTELDADERDPVENVTILSGAIEQGQGLEPCAAITDSCFEEHPGAGCLFDIDPKCCWKVCEIDPLCCLLAWEQTCADIALGICGGAYHVVTAGTDIDDPEKTVIDGFLIRDGRASGPGSFEKQGGGMFIRSRPSVVRCTFTQNTASEKGGGMSNRSGAPEIINCVFEDNPGDLPWIPENGGGFASFNGNPNLLNCLFVDNVADFDGGAIYNSASLEPEAVERMTLINCTIYGNTANSVGTVYTGGGLYNVDGGSIFDIDNCIFWDNSPNQIDGGFTDSNVDYSDVEDGSPVGGTDNIQVYPEFVGVPGNLRLVLGSPCIDKGNINESIIPCDFFNLDNDILDCTLGAAEATPDLDLIDRILDGDQIGGDRVDMGAYEFCHPNSCPWDLDGGGFVGAGDLLLLLADWGNPWGAADLLDLLAAWGSCPCDPDVVVLTLEEELADACLSQDDWDKFVAVMTDPNAPQVKKDRYLCWMEHYLFDCNKCICIGPSGCPNPDPFN